MENIDKGPTASMFKNRGTTLDRIQKFISPTEYADVNLHSKLYPKIEAVTDIQIHHCHSTADDKKNIWDDYQQSFTDAMSAKFTPINIGDTFGPAWTTHWFKLRFDIPDSWVGEAVVLMWNSGCEATVWKTYLDSGTEEVKGYPVQGLNEGREEFKISECLNHHELHQEIYLEASCLTLFGNGSNGVISPPDNTRMFTFKKAEITIKDMKVYSLLMDFDVIYNMAKCLPESDPRSYDALFTANRMVNLLVDHTPEGYGAARKLAENFLKQKNGDVQHTVHAIGHCHIDTAWLWRVKHSVRKVVRSWTSQLRLAEKYDKYHFACSQTVQHEWMKEHYPVVFEDMKKKVERKGFLPVGGTYVEMDGNIPNGESLVRQFLFGQRFYEENYGARSKVFWLPDTFGYTAQLPQIMADAGMHWFITQKMSWNLVNKFPHNSFLWEGLDGTTVLTHFPPADTYCSEVTVDDLMKVVSNMKDKGRVNDSMLLYGFGDGGGGPTEEMIQRAIRLENVSGCPKVKFSTPDEFFNKLEDSRENLCRWVGELYLELHQGTYTSQRTIKELNSENEMYLRKLDFINSIWLVLKGQPYHSHDKMERINKTMLLNQFHDIIPGSCIEAVKDDARKMLIENLDFLRIEKPRSRVVYVNSLPCKIYFPGESTMKPLSLICSENLTDKSDNNDPDFKYSTIMGITVIENRYLKVTVDEFGRLSSVLHKESGNETIPRGSFGNLFVLYDDVPLFWDAWDVMDYHLETRKVINHLTEHLVIQSVDGISVEFYLNIGVSKSTTIHCVVSLGITEFVAFSVQVGWSGMAHKFLKVEFPVTARSPFATYGVPFGHVQRPTHYNTSWDSAKYEVCTHGWFDVSQHDWGVSVLTSDIYGAAVHDNVMRLSLLRAPKQPDPNCDMGEYSLIYGLQPHTGTFQSAGVLQNAQRLKFNNPYDAMLHSSVISQEELETEFENKSLITIENPAIMLETIKPAEDRKAIVIRVYESYGSTARSRISSILPLTNVVQCNIIEDEIASKDGVEITQKWTQNDDGKGGSIVVRLEPFKILSLLAYY